jgi:hypothetical protein
MTGKAHFWCAMPPIARILPPKARILASLCRLGLVQDALVAALLAKHRKVLSAAQRAQG